MIAGNTANRRPLRPANFRANDGQFRDTYAPGDDIIFAWSYRVRDGQGRAAGEQLAGQEISGGIPTSDGPFRVRIHTDDGTTLLRTIDVAASAEGVTYDNGDLQSDFAGEPDALIASLTNVSGIWESTPRTINITKRT
jgi:hypothetical protein